MLTPELARRFARAALANIDRDYPRHALQLLMGPEQERSERLLHPAFYGSYDWHSAVHMHWTLMRVLRLYPTSSEAILITDALDVHLTDANLARELDYFASRPAASSSGRTAGRGCSSSRPRRWR